MGKGPIGTGLDRSKEWVGSAVPGSSRAICIIAGLDPELLLHLQVGLHDQASSKQALLADSRRITDSRDHPPMCVHGDVEMSYRLIAMVSAVSVNPCDLDRHLFHHRAI